MNNSTLYRIAKRRVAFKNHLLTYIFINAVLCLVDYYDDQRIDWVFWPVLGWGIGVLFDGLNAYDVNFFSVEKEMEKLKRKQQQ
jgi:hypothetical protein